MKNISLAIVTLFTTLSVGTLSSASYADDSTPISGCVACGCKQSNVAKEDIHREAVENDNDSVGSTKVTEQ
jgi:Zn ribbon nucleic-acid-binding protein